MFVGFDDGVLFDLFVIVCNGEYFSGRLGFDLVIFFVVMFFFYVGNFGESCEIVFLGLLYIDDDFVIEYCVLISYCNVCVGWVEWFVGR